MNNNSNDGNVSKTIIDWRPLQKQWWITGFNKDVPNKKGNDFRDKLTASYTVTFNNENMYEKFTADDYVQEKWSFDKLNLKASFFF